MNLFPPVPHPRLWRQGDILIEERGPLPEDGWEALRTRIIAKGEATGHAHRLKAPRSAATLLRPQWRIVLPARPGMLGLRVSGDGCSITHPEHAPIALEPGAYVVWRQREFDTAAGIARVAGD